MNIFLAMIHLNILNHSIEKQTMKLLCASAVCTWYVLTDVIEQQECMLLTEMTHKFKLYSAILYRLMLLCWCYIQQTYQYAICVMRLHMDVFCVPTVAHRGHCRLLLVYYCLTCAASLSYILLLMQLLVIVLTCQKAMKFKCGCWW